MTADASIDTSRDASTVRYDEHPAMFKSAPIGFIVSILLIPAAGLGLLILLWWYLQSKAERFQIIGDEIRYSKGLLSKTQFEVGLSSIRTVKVEQSFFNRIFGVGKVSVFTAGDEPEIVVAGLPNPHMIREIT